MEFHLKRWSALNFLQSTTKLQSEFTFHCLLLCDTAQCWNRTGLLILPQPCAHVYSAVYRTNSLLHQDSFFTQEIAPHCTLFSSAATSFLPRKEFDQPGLFGHRITCRRQLHLSNAAISNFEELAHKGFLCLMTISGNIKLCFIILGRGS